MDIKIYDKGLEKWVTAASSSAHNIEVDNPGFLTDEGLPTNANNAFTKLDNRLSKIEQNLAWVYLHGAKGGGGGGGGGEGDSYTIAVAEGTTVYTSTTSITINVTIKSGTLKKMFTLTAKNLTTNKVLGVFKIYSLTRTPITLDGIEGNNDIELSAYDSEANYAVPTTIKVIAGAIKLSLQNIPPKTIYIGSVAEVLANFTVTNNISGSAAAFKLTCNNILIDEVTGIITSIRALSYDIRKIIFENPAFDPKAGQRFYFEAVASTMLGTEYLESNIIKFDVSVADNNNLIIVVDGITETDESWRELTTYSQGSQLGFSYYLSYGLTKYSTFNIDYTITKVTPTGETLIDSNTIRNINKGETNRFVYSTVGLDVNQVGEYLKIKLYGYAVNDPGDVSAQYTKNVFCRIVEAETVDIYANNDQHTLLAYYSRVSGFPNTGTGTWNYQLPTSGDFIYEGTFRPKFPDGVNLTLSKVNGVTSGFIPDIDGVNSIPAIRLQGEAYGYLEVAEQMFPKVDINTGASFFQSSGFNISITYKADQSSNPEETVLSIGEYENGELRTGYEITLEAVTCKIGAADMLHCKLPQNELLTIDLDVSLVNGGWYFKIYINGILSAVTRVLQSDIDWMFGTNLYLGCRNDAGVLSNFSNLSIFDVKLYTSSQSEYAVVQNYISAIEQATLIRGAIDPTLDADLRSKNLFDSAGNCLIWDKTLNGGIGGFLDGELLYNRLIEQMKVNTPYPVVLVEETSNSSTLFQPYSTAIFSAADKIEVMGKKFPIKITYHDSKGKVVINTPEGVNADDGVTIGLQGTSSLSYNAKNFELYMGNKNEAGDKLLFQPTDDWLPENEFTLKADVMDSAHVNNVVIGKIVNGSVGVTPFTATPPMSLGNEVWGGDQEKAEAIRSKIKHTSDGFPCLLFIRYAPDKNGNTQQPTFCGIYNFNLGRYAYYNLGLKILTDYTKVTPDGPSIVTDYSENNAYWNVGNEAGTYSIEINQNSSSQGAFQQDDMKIIQFMADVMYTSRDEAAGYNYIQRFYNQMANMALTRIQKYTMDDAGQTPTKPIPGEFYDYDANAYYNFNMCDSHMNWDNACAYFVIALVFGMVDSMCKNLTLRNWGNPVTFLGFYDMDTAFGLNNTGQDIVEYWAHLHRWYNISQADTGITTYTSQKNYTSTDDIKQYFASWWNRIWEVLENLASRDSGSTESRESIESIYINLRTNLFPDPVKFINDNYKSYTDSTGSIIFNYDYRIKYLKVAQTYDPNTGEMHDSTDFSQLKFLHGNRVMHVRDWFKKRLLFLDGVYGYSGGQTTLPTTIESPVTSLWAANKATGSASEVKFGTNIQADSKVLYHYSHDKTSGAFWIDETDSEVVLPMPTGETIVYMYANKYITDFSKFKSYPWTGLTNVNLPLIESLDLSGISNIDASDFFQGGVYNKNTDVGLKNLKVLNLSKLKLIGNSAAAYTLDVSGCNKLQELDISYSTITKVTLPVSAVLKTYNLSGTNITSLKLENQSFLETVKIDDCLKLQTIEISNCPSLKTLTIPSGVTSLVIMGCESLETIKLPYLSINSSISNLTRITIDNCPGLKVFDINGQNNQSLKVELTGAWNLEELNISNTTTLDFILPALFVNGQPNFTSLKSLSIYNTKISKFTYNDKDFDYLDLSSFPDLEDINAGNCTKLVKVKCANNQGNPIELLENAFRGCSELQRVIGHYSITGTGVFRDCYNLYLNDPATYQTAGTDVFLTGTDVTNISFSETLNSATHIFSGCNKISYDDFKYLMVRLTPSIINIEGIFRDCIGISGAVWYDLFRHCPNVSIIREAFSRTGLSGAFYSRSTRFDPEDDSTWGILDFVPNLSDAESAFSGTLLEWIDNRVFAPKEVNGESIYSPIVQLDYMFSDCSALQSCEDTRADIPAEGYLESDSFFINLRNMVAVYPKGVFTGCVKVKMHINSDTSGNTLLFHVRKKPASSMILDNTLYSGVQLIGKIGVNVFGGINDTLDEYFIPTFTTINSPFSESGSGKLLTMDLNAMGDVFKNLSRNLLQVVNVFSGVKCNPGTGSIPSTILKGLSKVNSCSGLFSGILGLDNGGEVYEFPAVGMFDDCTSLQDISNILSDNPNLKIRLIGERFTNCQLTDVSNAFSRSHVIETIPYRLFFMINNNQVRRSISKMNGVFRGCFGLGYDKNRTFLMGEQDSGIELFFNDHIVLTPGNVVQFKLDTSNMVKSYNYDRNDDVNSPTYNPGEQAFDIWYLDGYGWEGAGSAEEGLAEAKARLYDRYFKYDEQQKLVITQQEALERYENTYQNYMIPTDLFRYCATTATCEEVLSDLTWNEHILDTDPQTGNQTVMSTDVIEGLRGRIPCKLLEALTDNQNLLGVFANTKFEAFVGLQGETFTRGIAYPPDLLKYNKGVTSLAGMFKGTRVPVGVDVNADLLESCTNLRTVSDMWSDCMFNDAAYSGEGVERSYPQFDFERLFKLNTRITNASGLFAINGSSDKLTGLFHIDSSLLRTCYNISNISSMFYRNSKMAGSVPTFTSATYPVLNVVTAYLTGCTKSLITNADDLEPRLIPQEWLS